MADMSPARATDKTRSAAQAPLQPHGLRTDNTPSQPWASQIPQSLSRTRPAENWITGLRCTDATDFRERNRGSPEPHHSQEKEETDLQLDSEDLDSGR